MALPQAVRGWAWYDFANSGYILVFSTFLLPAFFASVLAGQGYTLTAWGSANALSTVLGIVLALLGGRYADRLGKMKALGMTIGATTLGMFLVASAAAWQPMWVFVTFVITQAIFICSLSLSDSVLPHLSRSAASYKYSGFAWGMGYVGGIASLLLVLALQYATGEFSFATFVSSALFFGAFSWIAMRGMRQGLKENKEDPRPVIRETKKERARFLFGFWVISEVITVFILFFSLYCAQELQLSSLEIGYTLLLVQLVALPATVIGGEYAARGHMRNIFIASILCLLAGMLLLLLPGSLPGIIAVAVLGGLAVGNSQSLLRARYALSVHQETSGREFGWYSCASQAAVIIGPVLYGWSSDVLESQKIPLFILALAMLAGLFIVLPAMQDQKQSI